jgi:hypothetical protein
MSQAKTVIAAAIFERLLCMSAQINSPGSQVTCQDECVEWSAAVPGRLGSGKEYSIVFWAAP